MTETVMTPLFLLAANASATITSREFDWPESPLGWLVLLGGGLALGLWVVWLSVRDTRDLSAGWKLWLTALRLAVLAGLLMIALNPSDRTQKQAFRPSRVAVMIDTSLSMRHPNEAPGADGSPAASAGLSRAGAAKKLLAQTTLIERLRKQHEVSLFTFDSTLNGPHRVYPLVTVATSPDGEAKNQTKNPSPPAPLPRKARARGEERDAARLG